MSESQIQVGVSATPGPSFGSAATPAAGFDPPAMPAASFGSPATPAAGFDPPAMPAPVPSDGAIASADLAGSVMRLAANAMVAKIGGAR
jgi:hypothetical protein